MELVAVRNETWKGTVIGIGGCALTLGVGARLQAMTGDAGMLLGLFVATAVAAWYAGRWVGIVTTFVGSLAAAYILPPSHSFSIARPEDFGALSSFALGGVIVSLLCGAAWQLRLEARDLEATQKELACLRARNAELLDKLHRHEAALAASDRFFGEAALAAGWEAAQPEPCALQQGIRRMLEILIRRGTGGTAMRSVRLNADRLPDSWIFTAAFRPAQDASASAPLTPLELRACQRIVARQGGRCWTGRSGSGSWELKFTLPRS
jgi:hypothetical protein